MFTITITETKSEEAFTDQVWSPVAENAGGKKWDYTPQIKTIRNVTYKRLEQTVEDLDLSAVIKAINRLA